MTRDVILVVEDSRMDQKIISRAFQKVAQSYELDFAVSGEEALAKMSTRQYSAVLLDYSLPGMSGLEILQSALQQSLAAIPYVMLTGSSDIRVAVESMKLGAYDYVLKTPDAAYAEVLPSVVQRSIERRNLIQEKERLEREVHEYAANLEKLVEERTAQLRATTNFLNNIVESSTQYGIVALDLQGKILLWNSGAHNLFGYTKDEMQHKNSIIALLEAGKSPSRKLAAMRDAIEKQGSWQGEMRMVKRDGTICQVFAILTEIHEEQGQTKGILALLKDITRTKVLEEQLARYTKDLEKLVQERTSQLREKVAELQQAKAAMEQQAHELKETSEKLKEMNTQLQVQKAYFDGVLSAMSDYVRVVDRRGQVKYANFSPRGLELSETERTSHLFSADAPACGDCVCQRAIETGKTCQKDVAIGEKTFSIVASPLPDVDGTVNSAVEVIRDITERKKLESHLIQSQKMESIGLLAGGIAHNLNNMLGGVLGYASFMKTLLKEGDELYEYASIIEQSGLRATELANDLVAFARGGKYHLAVINLNDIVRQTVKFLGGCFDKNITIPTKLSEDLLNVEADPNQMQQVLTNLCVNARDAMPEGGTLTISSRNLLADEKFVRQVPGMQPGEYVSIAVSDTGIGIKKEDMEHLFEPFFSTKGFGQGLGLSSVYGILKNHGGHIRVSSRVGKGSTFEFYLPSVHKGCGEFHEEPQETPTGSETILIVDDERVVAKMASDILSHLGYHTIVAYDAEEGLTIYRSRPHEINLVFLDLTMPGPGAKETFLRLREINPEVRVVLTSGYAMSERAREIIREGPVAFVQKPYRIEQISIAVRNALDVVQKRPAGRTERT